MLFKLKNTLNKKPSSQFQKSTSSTTTTTRNRSLTLTKQKSSSLLNNTMKSKPSLMAGQDVNLNNIVFSKTGNVLVRNKAATRTLQL